jgi:3'-phosphoadenosine 5'-phosphosulfate sulfotransferase (PAPS reductase)/FAD synthetase
VRTVCWWSAGAASAVAAHLALRKGPAIVAYCDTSATEHPDNLRFLRDCENWYGQEIMRLRSDKYTDIYDVFAKTRYLVGNAGARCTTELKKLVRRKFQQPEDTQVFGFTSEEVKRAKEFRGNNIEVTAWFPLIDEGLTKVDCRNIIRSAGIAVPAMYGLGYKNNNCIGCVKGGAGYWNKIRVDFPEVFTRMAKIEREMGVTINKSRIGGQAVRVYLDELQPGVGRYETEPDIECGIYCPGESNA